MKSVQNNGALASLIAVRVIYAINWLNIGAIFVLMAPDLGSGLGGLGALTSAFYIGIGLAQIPGGIMAARLGPKNTVVLGVFVSSLSALGTAAATSIAEVAALRFLVGAGMALVFAPAVVIIARLLRGGRTGTGVGLFNSAFNVGGVIGIFGWVVMATVIGWRPSLALSGGIGVLTGLLMLLYVPRDLPSGDFRVESSGLGKVLADRQLVLLGLGTLGLSIGNIVISSFMGYYVVNVFKVSPSVGGAVQGLVVGVPIFTALWGGRAYDRTGNPRQLMAISLFGCALALVFGAYPSLSAAIVCSVLGGAVSGTGYAVAFAGAKDLNRAGERYDGLAVAWVNSISLTGSFVPPLIYSFLAVSDGYPVAWLGCALLTVVFLIPLLMMTKSFRT